MMDHYLEIIDKIERPIEKKRKKNLIKRVKDIIFNRLSKLRKNIKK